jgi:hypothetical protein
MKIRKWKYEDQYTCGQITTAITLELFVTYFLNLCHALIVLKESNRSLACSRKIASEHLAPKLRSAPDPFESGTPEQPSPRTARLLR